jgi:hypothetical protein
MRFIKTIPHDSLSIHVYSWNEKYIIKYESGLLEQIYKFPVMELLGEPLQSVEEFALNQEFLGFILQNFDKMWEAYSKLL